MPTSRTVFCSYVLLSTLVHSFICGVLRIAIQALSLESFTRVLSEGSISMPAWSPSSLHLLKYHFHSGRIRDLLRYAIQLRRFGMVGAAVFRPDLAQWPPFFQSPWLTTDGTSFIGAPSSFLVAGRSHLYLGVRGISAPRSSHREYSSMLCCMLLSFGMTNADIVLEDVFTALMGCTVSG